MPTNEDVELTIGLLYNIENRGSLYFSLITHHHGCIVRECFWKILNMSML